MKTFVANAIENLVITGYYETLDAPDWCPDTWPLYMIVYGDVLKQMVEILKTSSASLFKESFRSSSFNDEERYYIFLAESGYVSEWGNVPTGFNFKVFNSNGKPISSEKGVPFEFISAFARIEVIE